jgi:hypothetical protein
LPDIGTYKGNVKDKNLMLYTNKKYFILNPTPYIHQQESTIKSKMGKSEITSLIVVPHGSEFKNLKLDVPICTYTNIIDELSKLENRITSKEAQQLSKDY